MGLAGEGYRERSSDGQDVRKSGPGRWTIRAVARGGCVGACLLVSPLPMKSFLLFGLSRGDLLGGFEKSGELSF